MANLEQLKATLIKEGFAVSHFPTARAACDYVDAALDGQSIGFGGSQTVREMGLYERLSRHNDCRWHWDREKQEIPPEADAAPIYICSLNALSEDGALVNIDGRGNRVWATIAGRKKVYFLVGSNKIAPDFDAALWRARNIAAPLNARRLGKQTPCAITGKCASCASPDRICKTLVVFWEKPPLVDEVEVVLIDEALGY